MTTNNATRQSPLKNKIYEIIFEADTPAGKSFDVLLLLLILSSVLCALLETVPRYAENYGSLFYTLEWIFTIFFTFEYFLRIYSVIKPIRYITSFFGIIDLLAILPTFLSLIIAGTQSLIVIRALRLLRIFRIFKMVSFVTDAQMLTDALIASRRKIFVFLFSILLTVVIVGSLMYLIEGGTNSGFDSIPRAIYWAIVTLTTVGYGDISPQTNMGQFVAAFVMILGYAVIAVPTGIVTSELSKNIRKGFTTQVCQHCMKEGHDKDARFCKYCGYELHC